MSTTQKTRSERTVAAKLKWLATYKGQFVSASDCQKNNIPIFPLDLENAKDNIPLYFAPLSESFLAKYPVDGEYLASLEKRNPGSLDIGDYDVMIEKGKKDPDHLLWALPQVLYRHMETVVRKNIPKGQGIFLSDLTSWARATNPEDPVAEAYTVDRFGFDDRRHAVDTINYVKDNRYPHLTMITQYECPEVCPEGSLQLSELVYILKAMEFRLAEGLFDRKQPQPVLMVSFMVPRHGRILQAHVHGGTRLVIACSKLYSFKNTEVAPFELFYRWFLGTPIGVEPREMPVTDGSENLGDGVNAPNFDEDLCTATETKKGKKRKR
ncbi:hypothetical protein BO94DRAFT_583914 [Aspergillus sclerotioniger CBS 115572]|uniref:Uncharacterized protein n=1 Tax=Aspergillus sclerotioniger CBS 115572 TaxID=1450535 RepID=A0A317WY42_9EURO|nr:hypothetical protein BO94DRAFT_583914 [Aspergillus sclerotioniger CBS 115572]PWY91293.1 hypothetical protein BO94DRAFT_583914 [Aspergillus sclerotioniger CBS 115572]